MENFEFLPQVEPLIRKAGDFIRAELSAIRKDEIEYKGRNDMVSYVDRTAEKMLVEGLSELLPGSGFINEESGSHNDQNEFRWIIDPLDGTTNFLHGIPLFGVSVALQRNQTTTAGWVLEVNSDELFSAILGNGAMLNGGKIRVSDAPDLSTSLLATGFPYREDGKITDYLSVAQDFLSCSRGLRRFGAAAIDLAWTACGRFDGFYEIGLNAWDVAAGSLIIQEAGGTVSDFAGGNDFLFGRQIAASNGKIQGEMLQIIHNSL